MELNFEVLEMQRWNTLPNIAQRLDEKNGTLSIYHVYFQGYGH